MARGDPGEATYTPQVQPEDLPRKVNPEMRADPVGPAIQQLGNTLEQKYQADSATWAGDQVADFRLKAIQSLDDMKAKAPAGDPGNFTERYLQQFDKGAQPLVATAGNNGYAAQMVHKGLNQLRDTLAQHTMEWEATQRVAYQNDSLQTNLEKQLPLVRQHPELADQVGSTLMDQINSTRNDPATKVKFARLMDTQLSHTAALGLVDQNPGEVYSQLMSGNPTDPRLQRLVDPASRAQVLEAAQGGVVKNFADGALQQYRTGGPSAGQKAYASVDQLTLPGTPDQQEQVREKIRDAIAKAHGDLIAEQQQKLGPQVMSVEESLRSGNPAPGTRGSIWGLYNQNALAPHVAGAYLGQLDAIELKHADDGAGMGLINDAWNGKVFLDPKDKEQKTDAYNWFNDVTDRNHLEQGSQGWVNLASEFARRTGLIPDAVGDWARSVLVASKDPKQVLQAVDAIDRVRSASPRGFQYFEDDHKIAAMADSVANLTKAGTDPEQAIAIARENAAHGDTDRIRLDELWKQQKAFGHDETALDSVLQGQIHSDPRLAEEHWYGNAVPLRPPQMQADYYTATRAYFNYNGGNLAQAEASAARDIGNTWGITRMNGTPEITRYPPERIYRAPNGGPGLSAEDIRTDVQQTVLKNPESFQHWDADKHALASFHVDPQNVHLVPTPDTTLTNGRTWGLAYQNDDGTVESLFGKNGKPLSYNLPVTQTDYTALRATARKEAISKAQAEYDKQTATEKAAREEMALDPISMESLH